MNENLILIIGILVIIAILIVILKVCSKFRSKVYQLFIRAEKEAKKGQKMSYVINNLYEVLPPIVTALISKKTFGNLIKWILQSMFNVVSDFLNDGKLNKK